MSENRETIEKLDSIEKKVLSELPDFEGKTVSKHPIFGHYIISFNPDNRDDYANVIKRRNGNGVKMMVYTEEMKSKVFSNEYKFKKSDMEKVTVAYAATPENIRTLENITGIGVWVNPIEMHSGDYNKHKDTYSEIMKDLVSFAK